MGLFDHIDPSDARAEQLRTERAASDRRREQEIREQKWHDDYRRFTTEDIPVLIQDYVARARTICAPMTDAEVTCPRPVWLFFLRTWSSADSELTYGYFIDEAGVAYKKAHWAVAHRHGLFGLFSDKVTYTTGYRLEPIARSDVVHLLAGGGPHGFNRESRMEAVVSTMSSCLRNSDSTAFRRYA